MTREAFAAAVYSYARRFDASVTSWIRSPHHNAEVGGAAESPHVTGLGVDVVYDVQPKRDDAASYAALLGLRLLRESDHDHLQPLDWSRA